MGETGPEAGVGRLQRRKVPEPAMDRPDVFAIALFIAIREDEFRGRTSLYFGYVHAARTKCVEQ